MTRSDRPSHFTRGWRPRAAALSPACRRSLLRAEALGRGVRRAASVALACVLLAGQTPATPLILSDAASAWRSAGPQVFLSAVMEWGGGRLAGLKGWPSAERRASNLPPPTLEPSEDEPGGPAPLSASPPSRSSLPAPALFLAAPTGLSVTEASATRITLSWVPSGAQRYRVERGEVRTGAFTFLGDTAGSSFEDTPLPAGQPPRAYLYRVLAVDGAGNYSQPSTLALGTAVAFTDPELAANVTKVKTEHITELRQSVNAVRRAAGIPEVTSWVDDTLTKNVTPVMAAHVQQLRDKLNEALAALGIPVQVFANPELATGRDGTPIRKIHIEQLRERSTRGSSSLSGGIAVAITSPANNTAFGDGSNVQLGASASGGAVTKVEFFAGATKLGEDAAAPYGVVWANAPEGTHTLTAVATDASGATTSSPPVTVGVVNFTAARLDPANRTGGAGVDSVSRNFNWTLPVVSLPGRSGLDLGLTLSYNSLVWTKSASWVLFDGDWGSPSPGFRLGFPFVQQKYYNTQAGKPSYLLVTPSGARVELRQIAAADTYEAVDSSYLQLKENADGSLTVLTTGGTRMTYRPLGGVYRCTEIEDRNGNFITVDHDASGNVETVVDTLGRALTFNYDGADLKSITQTWQRETAAGATVTETRRWARFYYANRAIQTDFAGLTTVGAQNGQTFRALTKVELDDDSSFTFNYTTWGQVNRVAHYAADSRLLNYVSYNLPPDAGAPQSDCPRFTERRVWAAHWNGDEDGVPAPTEEAAVTYSPFDFAAGVTSATTPDGTEHKEFYETSGWRRGITGRSETWARNEANNNLELKKWVVVELEHDGAADAASPVNPRVRETNVHDSDGNRRRTRVSYTSFGLPQEVSEYDGDAATVLRRTHVAYLPASVEAGGAYTARRIIGLPATTTVYGRVEGQERLASKVTVEYDLAGEFLASAGTPTRHRSEHYGVGFLTRGNACRVTRWDADHPDDAARTVKSEAGYNTAGSVVFSRDALGHRTNISYADSNGGSTLAYPTMVTDPDNFSSTVGYNYGLGVMIRTVDPKGAAVKTFYDARGRVERVVREADGAYTRMEYGAEGRSVKRLTVVNTGQPETFSLSVTDGAGRVLGALSPLPGSSGGFSARRLAYDVMGRPARQSTPIEVSADANNLPDISTWVPAGDDATANGGAGWVYTTQTYDWMGRPRVTTLPKLNPADPGEQPVTRQVEYGGCGCAGGGVVTATDEVNRQERLTHDVLGRLWKAESLNPDGSVYRTVTSTYSAGGQVTQADDQAAGTAQLTLMTYDGHGRLKTRKAPIESGVTTYNYTAEGLVESVTDARGVTNSFGYNNRHLLTSVTYGTAPGVSATAGATFGYDEAGNRTRMTDGMGEVTYIYDTLSRLESEARTFSDPNNASINGVVRGLTYTYNLADEVASVTDPFNSTINYNYDHGGRTHSVTGSGTLYAGVSVYAQAIRYRAWGALRSLSYGNSMSLATDYDSRMRVSRFEVGGLALQFGGPTAMLSRYTYYADGRPRFADSDVDDRFDRAYSFDHLGRLKEAYTGAEARDAVSGTSGGAADGPYRQSYAYDPWDNMSSRTGRYWSQPDNYSDSYDASNRNPRWQYDAAGNLTRDDGTTYAWDAAGRVTRRDGSYVYGGSYFLSYVDYHYGGDSQVVKERRNIFAPTYNVYSSVLGRVVTEIDSQGAKKRTLVYAGGGVIAQQTGGAVEWVHSDPVTGSRQRSNADASLRAWDELDPMGASVGLADPFAEPPGGIDDSTSQDPDLPGILALPDLHRGQCLLDGAKTDCARIGLLTDIGAAGQCPDNNCGPRFDPHRDGRGQGGYVLPWFTGSGFFFAPIGPSTSPAGPPPVLQRRGGGGGGAPAPLPPGGDPEGGAPGSSLDLFIRAAFTLPQEPSKPSFEEKNDCQDFANIVENIANSVNVHLARSDDLSGTVQRFMDALATRFTELRGASYIGGALRELGSRNERFNSREFGSRGFAAPYFEPDEVTRSGRRVRSNQVRHTIGGLIAGYVRGESAGLAMMNGVENRNDPHHGVPDINLNNQTVPMGARIAGPHGASWAAALATWIRETLCAK